MPFDCHSNLLEIGEHVMVMGIIKEIQNTETHCYIKIEIVDQCSDTIDELKPGIVLNSRFTNKTTKGE